ncbi:Lrp/AsnC family transcriptional regulator [Streptomyces sp. NPDC059785]|uniref:Lrp/AsnC family transcriptional regulator n=1 Tax=Streptomyces sp. NPDC059785 TaxID=3346945 RepID=UPI003660ECA0
MGSDTFDALDLKVLHALEVAGRAPFSRIAEVLDVSDQTVARRYRRLRAEAALRVVGVRDGIRLGQDQWMLQLRCAPDAAEVIARALARRPDTAWIALASGGTEVVCVTRARSRGEQEDLLLSKLPRTPSIVEIRAHQVLHRFFGGPVGWLSKSRALTGRQAAQLRGPVEPPGTAEPPRITAEDEPIVGVLERDGRATYPELRRATGGTEPVLKRRLSRLLSSGAFFIDLEFDVGRFGYGTRAVLWVSAAPGALEEVGNALAAHPEVAFVAAVAGGACDLVAVVITRDNAELFRYLARGVGGLPGVVRSETSPVLRHVKQLTYGA